jgi:hypothetical protein
MTKLRWKSWYIWALPAAAVAILLAVTAVLSEPPNYRGHLKMRYAEKVYIPTLEALRSELNRAAAAPTMPATVQEMKWPAGADRAICSRVTIVDPGTLSNGQAAPMLIVQAAGRDGPLDADDRIVMWADGRHTVWDHQFFERVYLPGATTLTTVP